MPAYKIIKSGHVVEVFEYEKVKQAGRLGGRVKKYDSCVDDEDKERSIENARVVGMRRRSQIRRLALANFNKKYSKFITLTYEADIIDVQVSNLCFKQFIQRMRYKYGDFKYLAVIEFQDEFDRGVVHYHMLSSLPYIPNKELAEIWGNGFVKINAIEKVDNLGAYITKYMTKSNDERLRGQKAYLFSRNLDKPEKITENVQEIVDSLYGQKTAYEKVYFGDYTGKVEYREYNLERIKNNGYEKGLVKT